MAEIGDYIQDLERPGAIGIITDVDSPSGRSVTYTMVVERCTIEWQDAAGRIGAEGWGTGSYKLAPSSQALIRSESRDQALYYEAVTQ